MDGTGSKAADLGMKVARISDAAGKATSGLASLTERSGRKMQELGAQVAGVQGKFQSAGGAIIQAGKSTNAATVTGFGGAGSNMEKFREAVGSALVAIGGRLERLPEQIRTVAAKVRKGWDAIGGAAGAAQAAVGIAVTDITAYYSSMSEDTTTQVTGYLATVGQIAAAWATDGPILGVVAAGTALAGVYFGNAAKQAQKEAAALKEVEDAVTQMGAAYGSALMEFGASDQGRMAASWKVINSTIEDTDGKLKLITETFNVTFDEVATAIAGGGEAVTALYDSIAGREWDALWEGNVKGLETYKGELGALADSGALAADLSGVEGGVKDLNSALTDGRIGIAAWASLLKQAGVDAAQVDQLVTQFKESVSEDIANKSGLGDFFKELAPKIDLAVAKNKILVDIQEQFRQAQERLLPPVERFMAAWDRVKEKIDKASTAFRAYLDQVLGRESSVDQTIIALSERALTAAQGKQEGESDLLAGARLRENQRGAAGDVADIIGRFAIEANGDMGKLNASVDEFFKTLIDGATSPEQKKFFEDLRNAPEIAGAMQAALAAAPQVKSMKDFTDAWGEFVADVNNDPIRVGIQEAPNYEARKNAIFAAIVEMANARPQIKTYIEEGPGYQAVLDSVLADKTLLEQPATIPVGFEVLWGNLKESIASILPSFLVGLGAKPKENWNGGLETSPVLSTLAERGPEAIFPLTNPARMRQIMGIPQVARAFEAAGFGAPITGNAAGTNYAPVSVDQSQVNHFEIHEARQPRMTANEIVRAQRRKRFLGGHTLPVVVR
ncbi:MAG: hypothetical protein IPG97_13365 [Microthrixaceae bacterium]|nr:hypothetical protein [Microthrixaceae bacterium]